MLGIVNIFTFMVIIKDKTNSEEEQEIKLNRKVGHMLLQLSNQVGTIFRAQEEGEYILQQEMMVSQIGADL